MNYKYEGIFFKGKKNGFGTVFSNGIEYKGNYLNDMKFGKFNIKNKHKNTILICEY